MIRAVLPMCLLLACDAGLPDDVAAYQSCSKLNRAPIPPYPGDPHLGAKNVYACNVPRAQLEANTRPLPDGALIVKEATRAGEPAPWLIATARKSAGAWRWDEYTRNFADEPFARNFGGQGVCTRCHQDGGGNDPIFTYFAPP